MSKNKKDGMKLKKNYQMIGNLQHIPNWYFFHGLSNKKNVFLNCFGDILGTHWERFFEGVKNVKLLPYKELNGVDDGIRTRDP